MPNELNIALATTGLAVTCQPYQSGAAVGSAINCPETGSTGFYSGNMTGSAGTYQLAFRAAGANVGSGNIVWDGTNEIASSTLTQANVQSALTEQGITTARAGNLDNLDTTVSSRLAPSGTLATVTTLTNAPSVPTPSEIASQVRTELATELARVDVATSTRLASSAYTAPANSDITSIKAKTDNLPASPAATGDIPSANITAIKAKTDLLVTDRLAQCSTVATTGAQLAAALS